MTECLSQVTCFVLASVQLFHVIFDFQDSQLVKEQ